jgi:hypothetical protein
MERFKKILALTLLFVLGLGTLGSFASDIFLDSSSSTSSYKPLQEKLHIEKMILAIAEVEEVEEDDETHSGVGFVDFPESVAFEFLSKAVDYVSCGVSKPQAFVFSKTPIYFLFRNIRI